MNSEQVTAFLQEHWYIASVLIGARDFNWSDPQLELALQSHWYARCPPPQQRIPAGGVLPAGCPPDRSEHLGICTEIEIGGERL
mgnify:CR=1 FL=1